MLIGALASASAQQYPNRPITLVVPLPPGGTNDIMARIIGERMTKSLGQQIVVENRAAGGSGTVATRQVARATPDGYTILLSYTTTFATGPSMYKNAGYDVRKDFAPIGLIAVSPSLVIANKDFPIHDIPELLAHIRKTGEPFQYGAPGIGSVNHLAAEMFARAAKIKLMPIPYKGSNPLVTDLIGGHIKMAFNPIPVSRGALEGGLIRALAVTSAKRSSLLPDVATLGGTGTARLRRLAALRPLCAGRHAVGDRRATQQGTQRGARRRGGDQAHPPRRRGANARPRHNNTLPTSTPRRPAGQRW